MPPRSRPSTSRSARSTTGSASRMYVYPGTSSVPITARPHFKETLRLVPGENAFGVAIWGKEGWRLEVRRLRPPDGERTGRNPDPTPLAHADLHRAGADHHQRRGPDRRGGRHRHLPGGGHPGVHAIRRGSDVHRSRLHCRRSRAVGRLHRCRLHRHRRRGTFDGHTFALKEGRWSYTGTFDGSTATITGGPKGVTLVFPVGP